jgi:hypothetical protein
MTLQVPDGLRVLRIHGVEYYILWEKLSVGSSFFVPTTASVAQVRPMLKAVASFFDWHFEIRQRCEFGRYGVRVWRTY